jgi:hypothetical protein
MGWDHTQEAPDDGGGQRGRPGDAPSAAAPAAGSGARATRRRHDPAACIRCDPARARDHRGSGVHSGHAGQLGARAEHRAGPASAAGGDQLAGHLGVLARLGRSRHRARRRRAAGSAVRRGQVDGPGRGADLGVVRPARRPTRVGGGPAAGQRAGRAERRLSGHRDRGHDRRGRHRSALPEPPCAPAGISPDRPGGAGRDLRRAGAPGQRHLEHRAGMGRRRGPAPGRGVAAGPAVRRRDHRVDHGPERGCAGPNPVAPPGLGGRAVHRPRPGRQRDRAVGLRARRVRRADAGEAVAVLPVPGLGADPHPRPPAAGRTRGLPHPDGRPRRGTGTRRAGRRPIRAEPGCGPGHPGARQRGPGRGDRRRPGRRHAG